MEEQRGALPIDRLCRVLKVSPHGLRAFRSLPARRRQNMDMVVPARINQHSRLSLSTCVRPKMTEELREVGVDLGHRRVGRLKRENGIVVEKSCKFKVEEDQKMIPGDPLPDEGRTAARGSTSRRTCWIAT